MAKTKTSDSNKQAATATNPFRELPERVTLEQLAALVPEASAPTRALLLRNETAKSLVAWGVRADSQLILDDTVSYVGAAVTILRALGKRFTEVNLPPAIFGAVVAEALALAEQKRAFDEKAGGAMGQTKSRREDVRVATRDGVVVRDKAATALRNALGRDATAADDAGLRDASSPAALAKGLGAAAKLIRKHLAAKDADTQAALALWTVTEATAAGLEATAKTLKDLDDRSVGTRRVQQRLLDEQDGRVLALLDVMDRAFRQAHRGDATILVPHFRNLAGIFGARAARSPEPEPAPVPAPPADPAASDPKGGSNG